MEEVIVARADPIRSTGFQPVPHPHKVASGAASLQRRGHGLETRDTNAQNNATAAEVCALCAPSNIENEPIANMQATVVAAETCTGNRRTACAQNEPTAVRACGACAAPQEYLRRPRGKRRRAHLPRRSCSPVGTRPALFMRKPSSATLRGRARAHESRSTCTGRRDDRTFVSNR